MQRDLGHYLTMWDASAPLAYDRVDGDTSIVAAEPAVAIIGTLQTEDHRLLGGVETGLRARWLPHLYRGRLPARVGGAVPHAWTRTLSELTRQRPRYRLTLSREARTLWTAAGARWRTEAEDASPGVRAATGKADRQALRVALALAVGMVSTSEVPVQAMQAGVALVDYALGVWRALPEGEELVLSRAAERTSGAVDRLASWLERRPERQATRDRILRAQVAGIRTADALDAVLAHYEATYPGTVAAGESTSRGGRRGTIVRAPRRGDAGVIPRHRGITGACAATSADAEPKETCGSPRDLPEGSSRPEEPEVSARPEESTRVRGTL